ncbi:MAG: type II toxin-antitoxin system prevent-host-death family antitoxin [Deferrisomatales bacterium]|nr:type II toxin-antitoxin system prevent-host-death family antitoxin [Deferrisomatales bacterium]
MQWTIAKARQRFSELLQQASREPQAVCNRHRPVAAVVDFETFQRFEQWRQAGMRRSVADAFDELRGIAAGSIEAPPRVDRPNAWAEEDNELPR